jgi:hypothetical protein
LASYLRRIVSYPYICSPFEAQMVTHQAKVAQLVEHNLAKVGVASSNLVFRSQK